MVASRQRKDGCKSAVKVCSFELVRAEASAASTFSSEVFDLQKKSLELKEEVFELKEGVGHSDFASW
jgi:hypothetical protein